MSEEKFRIESDLLGELQVPVDAYYGVQTQRAINNYKISNTRMCDSLSMSSQWLASSLLLHRPTRNSEPWMERSLMLL